MFVNLVRGASLVMVASVLLAVLAVPLIMPTPALAGGGCSSCAKPKCGVSCDQKSSCGSKCAPSSSCKSKCAPSSSCKSKCNSCVSKCNKCVSDTCNKCESKCASDTCDKCSSHSAGSCNSCAGDYSHDSDGDPNYNNGDVFGF